MRKFHNLSYATFVYEFEGIGFIVDMLPGSAVRRNPTDVELVEEFTLQQLSDVDDLDEMIAFFRDLGLDLEGRTTIEGEWAGRASATGMSRLP